MIFNFELASLFFGAVFVMSWLPLLDTVRDETWKREDFWKLLEVTGLWLAAAVGISAIIVSSKDAHEQLKTLTEQVKSTNEQVKEAKSQRLLLVEQTRAHIRRDGPKVNLIKFKQPDGSLKVTEWAVSPAWTNTGATSARDLRLWYDSALLDAPFNVDAAPSCPRPSPRTLTAPLVLSPGAGLLQLSKQFKLQDLIAASQGSKTILLWGHMEFRDVYPETPLHSEDWCIALVPNDIEQGIFSGFNLYDDVNN